MTAYLDSVKDKRDQATASKRDDALLGVLQSNQTVAEQLANRQTGKMDARREKVFNALSEALENDDAQMSIEQHQELLEAVQALKTAIDESVEASRTQAEAIQDSFTEATERLAEALSPDEVADTLEKIEKYLRVPQKAPQVSVTERELDLKPILQAIKKLAPPDNKFELSRYRAQDIDNDEDWRQFIGFVSSDGMWYILENNITGNNMRYVFGSGDYLEAWNSRRDFEYKVLSEAIDEVRT